jgi:HSP20 family molecular chaperone IbpA
MSRVSVFQSPLLLGFDGLEQMLERATKGSSEGYPPYNIERHPIQSDGSESYRILLAVAGFTRNDLEITVENRQLHVRGRQVDDGNRDYLHRGIAARQFAKSFLLADGMEVEAARLEHGLLAIHLRKSAPDKGIRRIEISE